MNTFFTEHLLATASGISKKIALSNITFVLKVLQKIGLVLSEWAYFLRL